MTRLQRRYLRYWGIDAAWLDGTAALVSERRPDVVVAASFDVLPCLAAAAGTTRVWYAADEYARHHLSMLRLGQPGTWRHLFEAAVAGLYERTYSAHVDRAWVVSGEERRALKFVTGIRAVDVVPNGVDAEYFQPGRERQTPRSCTFWGRLDAGPNIQAVTWFCRRVWPAVRREFPDARFAIYGFQPVPEVRSLASDSVSIIADIPDIRPVMRTHEIVVLPFVSGGGIKNKLLEAAALGLPIIASPLACGGLDGSAPIKLARSPAEWVQALRELWTDGERRRRLGADARNWVTATHTWEAAARAALAGLPALAPSPPGFAGGEGG
ncbi:MAG: glycosyltransferase family 4 protein [Gemmataceae bacterium]